MAQTTIKHACGHTQVHQIRRGVNLHGISEDYLAAGDCTECYRAAQDAKRAAESAAAAAEATTLNLATLQGSEKQVAWALTIRRDVLAAVDTLAAKLETSKANGKVPAYQIEAGEQALYNLRYTLSQESSAKIFIDDYRLDPLHAAKQAWQREVTRCLEAQASLLRTVLLDEGEYDETDPRQQAHRALQAEARTTLAEIEKVTRAYKNRQGVA